MFTDLKQRLMHKVHKHHNIILFTQAQKNN
jgi:hypothetical protein